MGKHGHAVLLQSLQGQLSSAILLNLFPSHFWNC